MIDNQPAGDLPEGCPIPDGVADVGVVMIDPEGNFLARLTAPGDGDLSDREGVVYVTGVQLHIAQEVPAWLLEAWAGVLGYVLASMREQAQVRREMGL